MNNFKVHSLNGRRAYYAKLGRRWIVEENDTTYEFRNIEEMIKTYPDLLEIDSVKMSFERRLLAKREVVTEVPVRNIEVHSKSVTCYYCSGKGDVYEGILCPNCNGKGTFIVNTKGLG